MKISSVFLPELFFLAFMFFAPTPAPRL